MNESSKQQVAKRSTLYKKKRILLKNTNTYYSANHKSRSDLFISNSILSSISPFLTSSNKSRLVHGLSPLFKRSFSVTLVLPRKS